MQTNINVQELTVEASMKGCREAVHHAVMLDPLTAAVCTLDQIKRWWMNYSLPRNAGYRSSSRDKPEAETQ